MQSRSYRHISTVLILLIGLLPITLAQAEYNWPQFNGDAQHSGNNSQEFVLTLSNVSQLAQKYQITLPTTADGAPAYLSNILTGASLTDMLFVTTKDGHIVALNAHTGATIWSHQNGPGTCKINNGSNTCYTTSSPAVDPNHLYVYTYGLDGKAHKYQVADGTEITTGGWPETTTLKSFDEKGSSALSLVTTTSGANYLYVANGGYPGDGGDYQGHITAINLATGTQNVFNALCSDQTVHFVEKPGTPDCSSVQTAIWGRSAVVYDSALNRIYMSTGNGDFNPGNNYWGDTVFALNPDGTGANGKPLDTYTPTEFQQLQNNDTDIGSTAPVILPLPAGYPIPNLGLQSGKDAKIRLIKLDNLSNSSPAGTGHTGGELLKVNVPQGGEVLTAPATWTNPADGSTWVFIVNDSGASALKLGSSGSTPALTTQWNTGTGGTSPIIANGILFYASGGTLRALNPLTGAQVWSAAIGGIHWESPIVADSWVYVTDESSHLTAFKLPQPAPVAQTIGVYRSGTFYLRNANSTGYADFTISFNPGLSQPTPIVGNWAGSGIDTIGLYDKSSGLFLLRNTNTSGTPDKQFTFGSPGDVPIAGQWLYGNGHDGVGVVRPSNGLGLLRNSLSTGYADYSVVFGIPSDKPIVGDWNGDGVSSLGVNRPSNGQFYLTDRMCNCALSAEYGFAFGLPGDTPIAGDWTGQGRTGIGVVRGNSFLLRNQLYSGYADTSFSFGNAGDIPLVGHWGPVPPAPPAKVPAPTILQPKATQPGPSVSNDNPIGD